MPLHLPPSRLHVLAPSLSCLPWVLTLKPGSVTVHAKQQPAKHLCLSLWKGHTWWCLISIDSLRISTVYCKITEGHQNKARFILPLLSQSEPGRCGGRWIEQVLDWMGRVQGIEHFWVSLCECGACLEGCLLSNNGKSISRSSQNRKCLGTKLPGWRSRRAAWGPPAGGLPGSSSCSCLVTP